MDMTIQGSFAYMLLTQDERVKAEKQWDNTSDKSREKAMDICHNILLQRPAYQDMNEEEWDIANHIWSTLSSPTETNANRVRDNIFDKRIDNKTATYQKLTDAEKNEAQKAWNQLPDKDKIQANASRICEAILFHRVDIEDAVSFHRLPPSEQDRAKTVWSTSEHKTMEEANKICWQILHEKRISNTISSDVFNLRMSPSDMVGLVDKIFAKKAGDSFHDSHYAENLEKTYERLSKVIQNAQPDLMNKSGIHLAILLMAVKENEDFFKNDSFLKLVKQFEPDHEIDMDTLNQMEIELNKVLESQKGKIFNLNDVRFHLDSEDSKSLIYSIEKSGDQKSRDQLVQSDINTARYFLGKFLAVRPDLNNETYLPGLELTALLIAVKTNNDNIDNPYFLSLLDDIQIDIDPGKLKQMEQEFLEAISWDIRLSDSEEF